MTEQLSEAPPDANLAVTGAAQLDVRLRGVTKRFGSFTAVEAIDLDVERGQFVTLLGPSGCGKTTTLRMIGGFDRADEGSIVIDGQPIDSGPKRTRMVFQNYALFPHMTVLQNVSFGLRMERLARSGSSHAWPASLTSSASSTMQGSSRGRCRAASSSVWLWRGPW